MSEHLWYFAYGSNLDPDRFHRRVGDSRQRLRARLDGWSLRFAADVRSEGGGGAVIVPDPDGRVFGAVFLISETQMAAMDREEFDPSRDTSGVGERCEVTVQVEDGPLPAQVYTLPRLTGTCAPSQRYLAHIVRGLRDVGHEDGVVAEVMAIAAAAPGPTEAETPGR